MFQIQSPAPALASVAVIGCGHVGLVQAAGLASLGHNVVGVDRDVDHVDRLAAGDVPFQEPGLGELVDAGVAAHRLSFTTSYRVAMAADIVFLCVDTPRSPTGAADVTNLRSAVLSLVEAAGSTSPVIVNKSTAPIGTAQMIEAMVEDADHRPRVAVNPEFLRQAHAVEDFLHPERIVIGARRPADARAVASLYSQLGGQRVFTDPRSAELIKYAANAFLATRISFVNELARLAEAVGVQIDPVLEGMAADGRIGGQYLQPGIGFGGSCLPKDTAALRHLGQSAGLEMVMLSAVLEANREARDGAVATLDRELGGLAGRTVAVWGLTFKGGTDDTRDSPAVAIAETLLDEGASIRAFDPSESLRLSGRLRETLTSSPLEAVRGADALAILSDWSQFSTVPLAAVRRAMSGDLVFDGRNMLRPAQVERQGLRYAGIGRPATRAQRAAAPVASGPVAA